MRHLQPWRRSQGLTDTHSLALPQTAPSTHRTHPLADLGQPQPDTSSDAARRPRRSHGQRRTPHTLSHNLGDSRTHTHRITDVSRCARPPGDTDRSSDVHAAHTAPETAADLRQTHPARYPGQPQAHDCIISRGIIGASRTQTMSHTQTYLARHPRRASSWRSTAPHLPISPVLRAC